MREEKSYKDLQEEIADLIRKNETLNRQLIKTWRDMVRLADAMMRLDTENKELRYKQCGCHPEYSRSEG